jgi:hypothetical protein
MIDAGCDCCSYLPIAQFDTEQEALAYADNDENLSVYSDDEVDC